ncbi:MAG: hypothetical protein H6739_21170 [Alphaproteobacteria bacterium]|nr:hypothetical protein [Alphaproteobacteria bacterium]
MSDRIARPEWLLERGLALVEGGHPEDAGPLWRSGHDAGWPGFLEQLLRHTPQLVHPDELARAEADATAYTRLLAADALTALGEVERAEALVLALTGLDPGARLFDPDDARRLAARLRDAGRPLAACRVDRLLHDSDEPGLSGLSWAAGLSLVDVDPALR